MKKAALAFLVPALLAAGAFAQEKGEYQRWKLDFTYDKPANVVMKDAMGNLHVCWYMTYAIQNKSDKDIPLEIAIKAVTDTDKTYRDAIAPMAQRLIEKKTGKKYKNALDLSSGTIAAGSTIKAIALFGEIDPNWDWLHVRVAGLMDTLDKVKGKLYFEKKVFVTDWYRPGDEFASLDDEITFKGEKWVTEGKRTEIPQEKAE